ncbi:MAG: transglycosylase SLT domain-containing protein [Spirochaetes bacterium]|nr:transglycosylase SLT domain-containing protein [Spirochaetota bacterium]
MKFKKRHLFLILLTTVSFVTLTATSSFSWSLLSMFSPKQFTDKDLLKLLNAEGNGTLELLPEMNPDDFFASCENLSILQEQEVRKYLYIYLTTGRPYVIRAIENSKMYLPEMEELFNNNPDIHPDMIYIPLLESAFNPKAVSRTKATGMWQFVASTAAPLGLRKDNYVDERYDVTKSTDAAIRHIRYLHNTLKNWELVIAAYNGGAGHITRSINKSGTSDFWELVNKGAFREETNQYVPRFAALLIIYKNQEMFGLTEELKSDSPAENEYVTFENPVTLSDVAKYGDTDISTLRKLNPELLRNITPPYEKNYTLKIPKESKEKLEQSKEKKLSYIEFNKIIIYKVKKGDNLGSIARKHKTTLNKIAIVNSMSRPYRIKPGQLLYIPI